MKRADAEMFPYYGAKTSTPYRDFNALRQWVESLHEGLHHVVSWYFTDPDDPNGSPLFALQVVMPRKQSTASYETERFDRAEVEEWLARYVRARVMRWYGWLDTPPDGPLLITEYTWRHNNYVAADDATTDRAQALSAAQRCRAGNPDADQIAVMRRRNTGWELDERL